MKQACPIVSHAVLVGEGRKFVSLLLTLKVEKDPVSGQQTRKLSQESREFIKHKLRLSNVTTVDQAIQTKEVLDYIAECVEHANEVAISRVSKVKKWHILPDELDVLTGEITPTFKVKRKYISKKFEE